MAVITFSREAHSGTQDLARMLARRLGYRYVSRDELTHAVTARSGVERLPQTVESEGRALSIWEQLGEQLTGDREAYVAALKAVITDMAMADNVVIVGHGAGHFLRDLRTVVRVFVVAPPEHRALIHEQLPDLPSDHVVVEPYPRGNAAAVGLAMAALAAFDPDAVVAVLPSDHVVADRSQFRKVLIAATAGAGVLRAQSPKDQMFLAGLVPGRSGGGLPLRASAILPWNTPAVRRACRPTACGPASRRRSCRSSPAVAGAKSRSTRRRPHGFRFLRSAARDGSRSRPGRPLGL